MLFVNLEVVWQGNSISQTKTIRIFHTIMTPMTIACIQMK